MHVAVMEMLLAIGDVVTEDEQVAEIETDKVRASLIQCCCGMHSVSL